RRARARSSCASAVYDSIRLATVPSSGAPFMTLAHRLLASDAPPAPLLIRLMVGGVFLSEGLQQFLFPASRGVGRFVKMGIPWPELTGPFVGGVETLCGALLLVGLATRLAALPLIIDMLVALVATKIPILLGQDILSFHVRDLPSYG